MKMELGIIKEAIKNEDINDIFYQIIQRVLDYTRMEGNTVDYTKPMKDIPEEKMDEVIEDLKQLVKEELDRQKRVVMTPNY